LRLHVISFNIPYPPNYGGVMEVYYKLKALHEEGVRIHLHCFEYGRNESKELNKICEAVYYYHRDHSLRDFTSLTPYIVKTRRSEVLVDNLLKDDAPILFEGLHTCYYLSDERLKKRLKLVRMHNVESDYYHDLGVSENKLARKFYFYTEAIKLRFFEKILSYADCVLAISPADYEQLKEKYVRVEYLPSFHPNEHVKSLSGKGDFVLYHGNLSVNENNQAAVWLVSKVFSKLPDIKFVVAGSSPSETLKKIIDKQNHIDLVESPNLEQMTKLWSEAHIHALPTFQSTGIKQKLLHSLFNGRFVLTNPPMVENTGLERLCIVAETADKMKEMIPLLMQKEFTQADIAQREEILQKEFSNRRNATKLMALMQQLQTD
jgi:glycosyltransferase involved in cell wall biosynthesis